jgi:hypothetical protein
MALSLEQIREQVLSPGKTQVLKKAIRYENRLRFHTESFIEPRDISQPLTIFLEWVKTLIPKDKYKTFLSLFQLPIPTVQLIRSIYSELEKVFDGKDPSCNYQFSDNTFRDDWERYSKEILNEPKVWRTTGWDAVKTSINSILIVDLKGEQSGDYPEPYFYFLDIRSVIDYELKNNKIEWIIFRQQNNQIACFDDTYYRVLQLNTKGDIVGITIEKEHELGFCPARFFWSTPLTQQTPGIKLSPLSAQLANLDWLLFFSVSKRHLDLYAPYPIYSSYEADCDFANNETGDYCDGGYLRNQEQHYKVQRDGSVEQCPVCANKRLAGVGSFIEIPVPDKDGPDLRNPVQITTIDETSLKYNVDEVRRLKLEIMDYVVGTGGDIQQKQSINEMQVKANYESKSNILNSIKANLEEARKWVDDTCCKLRYSIGFLSSSISMGTEFYIYSVDDLYKQYKQAKDNGANEAMLDAISDQIIETEYRNDSQEMQRMLILKHLEPYRSYTFDELMILTDKQLLDLDLLKIKINFNSFVDRFERENINIIEFGSKISFNKKIEKIMNEFKKYLAESKETSLPVTESKETSLPVTESEETII